MFKHIPKYLSSWANNREGLFQLTAEVRVLSTYIYLSFFLFTTVNLFTAYKAGL